MSAYVYISTSNEADEGWETIIYYANSGHCGPDPSDCEWLIPGTYKED